MLLNVALLLVLGATANAQSFQKFKTKITTRNFHKGKTVTTEGVLCYTLAGKMITHFVSPKEYYLINTAKGEISLYEPKQKTVVLQQNYQYSTENTQLYFFLQNKKSDLGLKTMGFTIKNTRFEQDLMITQWTPPIQMSNMIKEVELVHRGANPIFMSYTDSKGRVIKKSYYYNYANFGGVEFPQAITQMDYPIAGDSIVSKTAYTNVKLNAEADDQLFNFTVPSNAKLLKNGK